MTKKTSSKNPSGLVRKKHVKVKTARGRKVSSQRWLQRQLNDPYVLQAQSLGYRSRAAFKILEINEKYKIIRPGDRVIDLGAAPGSWCQIALEIVGPKGQVLALDLQEIDPLPSVDFIQGDFLEEEIQKELREKLTGPVNVILSDMAASSTGHSQTDHWRIMALAENAFEFSKEILAPGGHFCAKVLMGGTEKELLQSLRKYFEKVAHFKPKSSRKDSSEMYVIGLGFITNDT